MPVRGGRPGCCLGGSRQKGRNQGRGRRVGTRLRFRVLDVNAATRRITLTRKSALLASDLAPLTALASASIGQSYDGYVAAILPSGLVVRFYAGIKGLVPVGECSDDYQVKPQEAYFPGQVVRCRVIRCDAQSGELNLSLRQSMGPKKNMPEREKKDKKNGESKVEAEVQPKKAKKQEILKQEIFKTEKREVPEAEVPEPAKKAKKSTATPAVAELTLDDLVEETPAPTTVEQPAKKLARDAPAQSGPSLRDICDEFEKRLVAAPNSSLLWIQYMSALLRASEPEHARALAERALGSIRFRDVQEKMNVWVAYMNLERAFGTADSLKKVFERACVYNEPKGVHVQLAKIYEETKGASGDNGEDLALGLHRVMCKKFSQSCKVWVGHMLYLYSTGSPTEGPIAARKLLPAALKSLPKRKHIKITCKAAQMEYKHASPERARTLFEGVLSNAPKRVDIWSVYLTMEENLLSKSTDDDNVAHVRRLFERIVHIRMSSKKAKFFFKRFLDFEKAHGSEEGVEHVKELARAYVESNMAQ